MGLHRGGGAVKCLRIASNEDGWRRAPTATNQKLTPGESMVRGRAPATVRVLSVNTRRPPPKATKSAPATSWDSRKLPARLGRCHCLRLIRSQTLYPTELWARSREGLVLAGISSVNTVVPGTASEATCRVLADSVRLAAPSQQRTRTRQRPATDWASGALFGFEPACQTKRNQITLIGDADLG